MTESAGGSVGPWLHPPAGAPFVWFWEADPFPLNFSLQPSDYQSSDASKVAALVVMTDVTARRAAEDKLAKELGLCGIEGVPMHSLATDAPSPADPAARNALEGAGVATVLVISLAGVAQVHQQVDYSRPPYSHYWGGYDVVAWESLRSEPSRAGDEELVSVVALQYSLRHNALIWVGTTELTDAARLPAVIQDAMVASVERLNRERGSVLSPYSPCESEQAAKAAD